MKEPFEKIRGHRLLTSELLKQFSLTGVQEHHPDPMVLAKYFDPNSRWTWYATEYDPENQLFFGLIVGFEVELGYFSYEELVSSLNRLKLPLERDLSFVPTSLSKVRSMYEER